MTDRYVVSKEPCPRCRKLGRDSKGDNLAVYSDGGTWCFACNRGTVDPSAGSLETYESEDLMEFGRAEWDKIKKLCALSKPSGNPHEGFNYRDISDDTYKVFGVLNLANASGDSVAEQYYPLTQEVEGVAQLCGTKVRRVPKSFSAKGSNKALTTQLFGQSLAEKSGKKTIVIASGECDAMAAFEMLKGLGQDCPAIVSSTVGENGVKQFRAQYAFLDKFEKIIVIPDQDKAGREALANLAVALPRGKVFVVDLPKKDVNEMLSAGLSIEFLKRYRAASPYVPDGVLGSSCLFDKVVELAGLKKVPLPDFLWRLQDMLAGGFALESIVNLISGSGAGKCLAKGTPVLMADMTVKAVEDIRVGDRVMHPLGGFNTVTALGHGYDEMYEVSQSYGMSYTVNSEHILSFKVATNKTFRGQPAGSVVNLPIREYLELPEHTRTCILKGWRGSLQNLFEANPLGISEDIAYLLGYWLGDGFSSDARIVVGVDQKEAYEGLKALGDSSGLDYNVKVYPSNQRLYVFTFKGLYKYLDMFGLKHNKHVPQYFLTAPKNIKLQMLAGILDSDGHRQKGNSYEVTFKSLKLIESLRLLVTSLGGRASLQETMKGPSGRPKGLYYRTQISGVLSQIPCRIGKKRNDLEDEVYDKTLTKVSVAPVGYGEYYGFTLDGDHLFCLQDGTVTHNTTYTNELIYYWIFNSPYKVGILTMELSAPQYAQVLLSRHLEDKISNMTPEAQREFLAREDVQEKAKALFTAPDGTDRFFLIDERSNDIETMQKLLEQLIISAGCKILIIDPLQDVVASSDLAAQQQWMAWEKVIVKQYGVLIFNVCHTRKSVSGEKALSRGGQISEEMVEGSSTIIKSAKINILFNRDKLAEDPIVKNTTTIEMTKNRDNGSTGRVVEVFYDNMTHRLYDLEDYKLKHPEKFVQEVEGDINSVSEAIKGCEVVKDV